MPHASDPRLLALHALRVKGFAEPSVVSATTGLSEDDTAGTLKVLADEGLVLHRQGRITGWALTADGRRAHAALVAAELDDAGVRAAVDGCYQRFRAVNPDLLQVCTDWQLRATATGQTVNDHRDAGYDDAVIERLGQVHERARPVVDDLGALLDRFAHYGVRLERALERVRAGEHDWFTRPMVDSYHTVWFELHEDLLATLGLERGSEGQSPTT